MNLWLNYYGSSAPMPPRTKLRAGRLTAVYESGDLRYIRHGDHEICRRWYAAVRDHNWGTVPGVISDEVIHHSADNFQVQYTCTHQQGDIHFVWKAVITGVADGTITFTLDGEAKSTFRRNRIGFCVLHPPQECAGARCRLELGDGRTAETTFPTFIAPQNPFRNLAALAHEVTPGVWAEWRFTGDQFETEDQRNWIDASFKTFCTPLDVPHPVEVKAGARVRQTVTLRFEQQEACVVSRPKIGPSITLRTEANGPTLPAIGVGTASHGQPLTAWEVTQLRELRPQHLRVELDLTTAGWRETLRQASAEARSLGAYLEAAVTVSDAAWEETALWVEELHETHPPLTRVLAFHDREWATPERIHTPVQEAVARFDASIPVLVGTTANFTELNRGRPPIERADGVCYSVQPQEHAFDNASLIECCVTIADTVRSARQFCSDRPISVTPVTLRKRVNPYASGPAMLVPSGTLPPNVDPRQMSLFGAGWTLAALKYLAESGVASATFYETTGWLGVIERESGCRLPDQFPSRPGMVFPLFHVLADAIEFAGGQVVPVESSDPLTLDGLAIRHGDRTRIMLANLTDTQRDITLTGLPAHAVVRLLDETSFDRATARPSEFRGDRGESQETRDGTLTVGLHPYAYARIDCS